MNQLYAMIIDGHAHACGEYLTVSGITGSLDVNKVDKVVLVPGELNSSKTYNIPDVSAIFPGTNLVRVTNLLTRLLINLSGKVSEIQEGNQYVFDLARQCPGRILQFFWVLQMEDLPRELESKYEAWNFKGLKLHQCWEKFSVDSDYFRTVAGFAAKHDLPLFIHLFSNKEVQLLIEYHQTHPDLKLIIGHLFGMEIFIEKNIKHDNIYFEISTPQLISRFRLLRALNYFGPERLILGSDTPYGKNNLALTLKRIDELPVSGEKKDLILGGTMKRLLKI